MAVLGSGLASSWLDENEPTRNISIRHLKDFPLPSEPTTLQSLASVADALASALAADEDAHVAPLAAELESTVNDAYRLSDSARRLIAKRLSGATAPEGVVRYLSDDTPGPSTSLDSDIPSFGHVLRVTEDGLTVWISGVSDYSGIDIAPPLQIPGWLCREGSDFTIRGRFDDLNSARYGFHRADWLSEDELISLRSGA